MPNSVRVGVGVTGVGKLEKDLDRLKDKFARLQKQGAKGVAIGFGASVTSRGINAVENALRGVLHAFGDATQAAIEDEASQQKLASSLKANVKGWDGNTAAIEKTLAARMKLGFSDDEQRDSLAKLVVATNDVNKALAIQRTAMDLARLKGISLGEASEALTKIEGGQFRGLKALGIELKAGATAQDALNAVTKAATGQAEDYAETTGGKMLTAQVRMNEASEEFGRVIMPIVAEAMETVVKAMDRSSMAYDDVADAAAKGSQAAQAHLNALEATGRGAMSLADDLSKSEREVNKSVDLVGDGFRDMAAWSEKSTDRVTQSFDDMVNALSDDVSDLIDDVYDPAIQAAELAATKHEAAELRKVLASKNATAEEKRDARDRLLSLTKSADETRLALLETGNLTAEDTAEWLGKLQRRYDRATGRARADIATLMAKIRELAALEAGRIRITVGSGPLSPRHNQEGDIVAHEGGIVPGPRGAERMIRAQAGEEIIPIDKVGKSSGNTYNLNVIGNLRADDAMSAVRAMRRLESVALTPNTNGQR